MIAVDCLGCFPGAQQRAGIQRLQRKSFAVFRQILQLALPAFADITVAASLKRMALVAGRFGMPKKVKRCFHRHHLTSAPTAYKTTGRRIRSSQSHSQWESMLSRAFYGENSQSGLPTVVDSAKNQTVFRIPRRYRVPSNDPLFSYITYSAPSVSYTHLLKTHRFRQLPLPC